MSTKIMLKNLVAFWSSGMKLYSSGEYTKSAEQFLKIAEDGTARISYNLGCIYKKIGKFEKALDHFKNAIEKDKHLVVAYVQMGAIYIHFDLLCPAVHSYRFAANYIRNCKYINYKPLGLNVTVYLTQVLYNQASVEAKARNWEQVEQLLLKAVQAQEDSQFRHLLDKALHQAQEKGQFAPITFNEELFNPPKLMVQNLESVDYLGDSVVIITNKLSRKDSSPASTIIESGPYKDIDDWNWPSLNPTDSPYSSKYLSPPTRPLPDVPVLTRGTKSRSPVPVRKFDHSKERPSRPPPPCKQNNVKNIVKSYSDEKENQNSKPDTNNFSEDRPRSPKIISVGNHSKVGHNVTAQYSMLSTHPNILSFDKGDKIEVIKLADDGWFHGSMAAKSGLVPWNCIQH